MTELLFRDDAYLKTATARVVGVQRRQGRARPHDLLSARRRAAGRHRLPRSATTASASRSPTRARATTPGTVAHHLAAGRRAARSRRDGRPRDRLGAALRAHAPAHRAARDVLRRRRAGDRRQHRARQGAARFRHRHHAARRRAHRAGHERADRARRRDRDRLDHGRGARRAAGARQDHERAAAARRRAHPPAAHSRTSTCSPAAARTSPTSPRSAASRSLRIRNEGKRNKRVEIALAG